MHNVLQKSSKLDQVFFKEPVILFFFISNIEDIWSHNTMPVWNIIDVACLWVMVIFIKYYWMMQLLTQESFVTHPLIDYCLK